jgi:hypothetical protein
MSGWIIEIPKALIGDNHGEEVYNFGGLQVGICKPNLEGKNHQIALDEDMERQVSEKIEEYYHF